MWEPKIYFQGDGGGPSGQQFGSQFGPPADTITNGPSNPPTPGQVGAGLFAQTAAGAAAAQAEENKKKTEAQDFASTEAGIAAQGAGRESAAYARSQGMNPAQAALLGGQTAGNAYGGSYGTNLYNKLGLDMQKYAADKNYQMQQNQLDQQNQNNTFSAIGSGISFLAPLLFSDRKLKEDIKDGYGILDAVTKAVPPRTFRMKGDGQTQLGVMAQDLEKTPLASTVVDTPEGKMVDTRKLTTANTAMLSDLSKKVDTLYSFLKEASGGPARAS